MSTSELIAHKGYVGLTYDQCLAKSRIEVRAISGAIDKTDPGDNNSDVQEAAKTWCNMINPGVLKDR